MKAIIMAGGQGTRLRPLTCSVPKPLSRLCGRPVVHYILDLLDKHGFEEAIFTLGYKAEQIEDLFESGRYKNVALRFSREESPLGTAGCVKNALTNGFSVSDKDLRKENFLVISGDALCDFDLSGALGYHEKKSAAATIITKRVDDPREYGLVLSEKGKITGFSEKPSYLSCMGDCANTGVYVLSSEVLKLIPNNASIDFARDVFPKMMSLKMPLYAYEETGYWCDIGDFSTYAKSQFDILTGKVKCDLSELGNKLADGIYSKSEIPANVKITSPCYIGQNVGFSVSKNTASGTIRINSSVIGDNVSIGNNTKILDSIILDSAFISDGVTANGAIVCPEAKLLHSASIYEGSVVGEGCLIGREAIVSGGVKIWNKKTIPPGANVTRDIKFGERTETGLSDKGVCGETNAEISPEFCARLGAALACTIVKADSHFSGQQPGACSSVAISCENNNASIALKHAIMAGAAGGGGDVFDVGTASIPQLIHASMLLNCGIIARVKANAFTEVEILARGGLNLTRVQERRLEAAITRSEYKNADWNNFGRLHVAFEGAGFDNIYNSALYSHADFISDYNIKLNCNNAQILKNIQPVFESVSSKNGEVLIIMLTEGGSKAEFYTESNKKISYEQLILLAAAETMQNGNDVALPNDFASCADFLATSYGKKVYRYFLCPNDSCDSHARTLALKQPFLYDGAVLALNVLKYLSSGKTSIENAVKAIPQFASERREVKIDCPPQRIISKLCESGCGKGEGVLVEGEFGNVLVRSTKSGASLLLFAESLSSETASQLCDNTEDLIKKLMKH